MNRRKLLAVLGAAALVGSLVGCAGPDGSAPTKGPGTSAAPSSPTGNGTATGNGEALSELAPTWDAITVEPLTPDAYYDRFMEGLSPEVDEFLALDGVRALHVDAATAFPFPLPPGWTFPADPGYYDDSADGPNWSSKLALGRVWEYWNYANVTEAHAAWDSGDEATALAYLDVVRDGFLSPVFPVNFDGNAEAWYEGVHGGFRDGDYSNIDLLVHNPFPWKPRGS